MAKMGRPSVEMIVKEKGQPFQRQIDFNQVLYWLDLGATKEEIAGAFYTSADTLGRRIEEHFGMTFAELKEKCVGAAKIRLRHNQMKLSEKSAAMAIWLGKVMLGQKDNQEMPIESLAKGLAHVIEDIRRKNSAELLVDEGMATQQSLLYQEQAGKEDSFSPELGPESGFIRPSSIENNTEGAPVRNDNGVLH